MRKALKVVVLVVFIGLMFAWCQTYPVAHARGITRAERVVAIAKTWKGTRYRYGGCTRNGVDCSCLTRRVYRRVGVRLPRTARDQWRAQRRHRVSRSHRRPGDLVALLRKGRAYHMGVYVGRGRMVHAPHRGARVRTDRVPGKAHYARLVK